MPILWHKVPTSAPGIEVRLEFFGQGQHKIDVQGMTVAQEEPGGIKQYFALALVFGFFGRISTEMP